MIITAGHRRDSSVSHPAKAVNSASRSKVKSPSCRVGMPAAGSSSGTKHLRTDARSPSTDVIPAALVPAVH
jgi:hypothetical protein